MIRIPSFSPFAFACGVIGFSLVLLELLNNSIVLNANKLYMRCLYLGGIYVPQKKKKKIGGIVSAVHICVQ